MNPFTRISGKGQVVVPKGARDRLGWAPGTALEVIESGDSIMLRRERASTTLLVDEAIGRLQRIYKHEGPAVPVEQLGWSMESDNDPVS